MSDTARDYQTIDLANTDGLEDFFVVQDKTPQDMTQGVDDLGQDNLKALDASVQDWTISEAAKAFGVSEKTITRRLQKGTLTGYKLPGQFGLEWRVRRTPQDKNLAFVDVVQDRTTQDNSRHSGAAQDSAGQGLLVEQQREEIAMLRKQIEGAIYRNGYLEAKLEERENTIKLLTDSQHKTGWWAKFSSWFFRSR